MLILKLIFVYLMLVSPSVTAGEIKVSVDRNPVNINDSFQLVFSTQEEPDNDPDFSILQDNFEIMDQQRTSNSAWINGRSSRTEQWILRLVAKKTGVLLIPPIAFGSDTSKPLQITVNESQNEPQNDDDLFLEVSATPEKPYVQSQVLYTLKLYRRVQIAQARVDDPQLKEAVVEKLGEDTTFSTQIKGVDYWVTERKYAIFPQQSGQVIIPALSLNAEVLVSRRSRFNGFFNQQSTENRHIVSKSITLNVQPVPIDFNGTDWLSAESLELSEDWSDSSLLTRVGEPLTRTLRLVAKGTTVGQLPELNKNQSIEGIKTYPDQPVLKEDKQADGLAAIREEKIAFITSKAGDFILPAAEIKWFNTQTQRVETLVIPSVKIRAQASKESNSQNLSKNQSDKQLTLETEQAGANSYTLLMWQCLAVFFALAWLFTLFFLLQLLRQKKLMDKVAAVDNLSKTPDTHISKALKLACSQNQAQTAKQLLLQWGKLNYGVENLVALASHSNPLLAEQINNLNQYLYSGKNTEWDGDSLWQAFSRNKNKIVLTKNVEEDLEPLYKL